MEDNLQDRMVLEINVSDTIQVFEFYTEGIKYLFETIENWYKSNDPQPLNITLRKMGSNAPPTLGINVHDTVKGKSGLV